VVRNAGAPALIHDGGWMNELLQLVPHSRAREFGSVRPAHSATSQRETVTLLPLSYDVICNEVNEEQNRKGANSEVDRLRSVSDEDRQLFVVDEQAQCARRRVEVSLQHHYRPFVIVFASFCIPASAPDMSIAAATKGDERRTMGER
jgi:hypothetical protein